MISKKGKESENKSYSLIHMLAHPNKIRFKSLLDTFQEGTTTKQRHTNQTDRPPLNRQEESEGQTSPTPIQQLQHHCEHTKTALSPSLTHRKPLKPNAPPTRHE